MELATPEYEQKIISFRNIEEWSYSKTSYSKMTHSINGGNTFSKKKFFFFKVCKCTASLEDAQEAPGGHQGQWS